MLRSWFGPSAEALTQALRDAAPEAVADTLAAGGPKQQREALLTVLDDEANQERPELLRELGRINPELAMDWIEAWQDRPELVEVLAKGIIQAHPRHVDAAEALVRAWLAQGQHDRAQRFLEGAPAQEPVFHLLRAELHADRDELDEALAILEPLCEHAHDVLRHSMTDPGQHWRNVAVRSFELRDMLLRHTQGAEAVLRAEAAAGRLMPNSGVNHMLVGQAAMAESPRVAEHLELAHPDVARAWARERLQTSPGDRAARVRQGEAALRDGDLTLADKLFRSLVDEDPSYFPGQLGLGAVLRIKETGSLARVGRLPPGDALDPRWHRVVPDWPALLPSERAVVAFSAGPLARALPGLLEGGATVRLLPLDVRPTDLEALATYDEIRSDDGRALAGIGGMATTAGIAVARIEGLLAVGDSLVFAHELAHLAFWALPEQEQGAFEVLFEAARELPWAWTEYQQSNIDEFFAVSYEQLLLERLGVTELPPDTTGWWARVKQFLEPH